MHVGMIGLGKMGGNMAARLLRDGHTVVGTARHKEAIEALEKAGGQGASDVPQSRKWMPSRPSVPARRIESR